ncbi:hypothetical protein NEF87_001354 [Candidatus Lokiarchaeum ossiferum]|uniref:Acetyltransferase n=1 Tax=Candidatus Lokiarchaeum ossiferum TaxID=2951803 RepID=A0ABY6HNI1_9ARCH|nr:hypothetical protein NEF87_001354 [Candidatus Lokiarchaeum sp. B-35]
MNKVTTGKNVLMVPNVQIYAATHSIDPHETLTGKEAVHPINIGNNVWIEGSVIICYGVSIGDNFVIGAGSVVVRNIPPMFLRQKNLVKCLKKEIKKIWNKSKQLYRLINYNLSEYLSNSQFETIWL